MDENMSPSWAGITGFQVRNDSVAVLGATNASVGFTESCNP